MYTSTLNANAAELLNGQGAATKGKPTATAATPSPGQPSSPPEATEQPTRPPLARFLESLAVTTFNIGRLMLAPEGRAQFAGWAGDVAKLAKTAPAESVAEAILKGFVAGIGPAMDAITEALATQPQPPTAGN
jgi:hypothetical protein